MTISYLMWIINVYARQGYHQITVKKQTEKIALLGPDDIKWTFKVMNLGPTSLPPFFTCVMRYLTR